MRLLWLIDSLNVGGAESLVVPFATRAPDITVAFLRAAGENLAEQELRRRGVRTVSLEARNLRDRAAFRRLFDLVREEKVDLVHAHLAYSAIWSALLTRRTGIPSVVSLHASPAATKSLAPGLVHGVKVEIKDRLMRFVVNRWSRRDAVERVAGMHFLIVGDGPKRAEWQAMTTSDRVHWAGYRTDVDAILAGCDLFVHPSLDDAFPTVLLEAMAAGLPVVASNVGGIPEIVATPPSVRTGILVPPGDPAAFANAIRNIAPSMGIAGRERAEREFSIEAWMARLERVYAEALA